MLQASLIGYIGNDAEVKVADGHEFTTFRVAHSDRWKDDAGNVHESTQWIDCTMDGRPRVLDYLRRGAQVYVTGSLKTRVYSSKKDRCMKAGLTINVRSLELLGSKSDPVPGEVVDANGALHKVTKYFHSQTLQRKKTDEKWIMVFSPRTQESFKVDTGGFIYPDITPDNNENNEGAQ